MTTQRAVTTQYCHTDKSVETLTNPNTCQGHMMKTRRGGGGQWEQKKALNYRRQTANKNVTRMQYKGPYNKARKFLPLRMTAVKRHWQQLLKFNLA